MNPPGTEIVSLRNVGKTFESGTVALDGLSLDVRAGEFVSLLGPVRLRQIDRATDHCGLERGVRGHGRMADR